MNKTIFFAISLFLLSCGGGGGDTAEPTPQPTPTPTVGKFLTKQCDMPAEGSEITIALTGLTKEVTRTAHVGTATWVTTTLQPYTGGTPQVTVACTQNLETATRTHDVIFLAASDTLLLTVSQQAYQNGGTDVNNPVDTPTDQPAWSRQE